MAYTWTPDDKMVTWIDATVRRLQEQSPSDSFDRNAVVRDAVIAYVCAIAKREGQDIADGVVD